ncbi:MAG: hypothetical protein AB8F94_12100 [Saprospiraceae bacterium]
MPVIKRFGVNYLEDFEEVDEHAPFSTPNYVEEEEGEKEEEKATPTVSIWKKYWIRLKSFFL